MTQAEKRPIIIDCDPGQDDAIMLLLAFAAHDALDIRAIVAVAGNVSLDKTARNARLIADIAGRTDVAIYAGADRPLKRALEVADHVHGREGLEGIEIFEPRTPLQPQGGVAFMIDHLRACAPNEVTLVATGPLTNVAQLIETAPDALSGVAEIVIMGGAMREGGNVTPSAEYNIFADPDAAAIVFDCGRPITAIGLDVTHQLITTPALLEALRATGRNAASAAHDILAKYAFVDANRFQTDGAPLHDPCTIGYLLEPSLFQFKDCNIRIETQSPVTLGHTSVDFWNATDLPANARWAHSVNRDGFFALLLSYLEKLS